jgi:choice-of-anchor B domain-containing protein
MKKILIIIIFSLISIVSYAQTIGTGYKIKLLKNVSNHAQFGESSYSALWGYTAPNGREYAILGCYAGTAFIDITDTNNIHEVDFLPCPNINDPGNNWREMKVYSHYAYVVSEAQNSNIQIIDLQYLPDSVRYVGKFNIPGHSTTHTISQSGPYLYLNGTNSDFSLGFAILDLSINPEVPVLRGKWQNHYDHDSRVVNDTVWVTGGTSVSIINVTNKNNPVNVHTWLHNPPPNSAHNIALSNDTRYAFITDETFIPSPGRLKIWDVSDRTNPIYLISFNPTPFELADVHNVEVYGNYAILAHYTAGVKILNVSNPANPVEVGWYDTYPDNDGSHYDGCWAVYYFPSSNKIIASDQKRGLFVLRPDLSVPVSSIPKANFSIGQTEVLKRDSVRLIDASEGIPTSWLWTVTGPENKTSTFKHPKLAFNTIGTYSVKLKVTNSFGSDSLTKTNYFTVKPRPFSPFIINTPSTSYYTIHTTQNDTSTVYFDWQAAGNPLDVNYKLYFRKATGQERYIPSGNNGADLFLRLRKSYLDSMAVQFGLTSDSVLTVLRGKAYNEIDSITSTNNIIFVIKTNTVGIGNISDIIPDKYNLYQNYPNPFNPETNIKFDLPKNGYVNLILYDITGKEILKLVNQNLQAGKYNYKLNALNLNSGVYFIRIVSNDFVQTRKIVLLK